MYDLVSCEAVLGRLPKNSGSRFLLASSREGWFESEGGGEAGFAGGAEAKFPVTELMRSEEPWFRVCWSMNCLTFVAFVEDEEGDKYIVWESDVVCSDYRS